MWDLPEAWRNPQNGQGQCPTCNSGQLNVMTETNQTVTIRCTTCHDESRLIEEPLTKRQIYLEGLVRGIWDMTAEHPERIFRQLDVPLVRR